MTDSVRIESIVLTGSLSPFSLLIMGSTWSKFSHVGFTLSNGKFLDAHPLYGVTVRNMPKKALIQKVYPIADPGIGTVLYRRARTQVGKHYDWEWILGYPFNRDWQDPEDWVCFEFVAWTLRNHIKIDKKLHRITGRQLERALDRWANV